MKRAIKNLTDIPNYKVLTLSKKCFDKHDDFFNLSILLAMVQ